MRSGSVLIRWTGSGLAAYLGIGKSTGGCFRGSGFSGFPAGGGRGPLPERRNAQFAALHAHRDFGAADASRDLAIPHGSEEGLLSRGPGLEGIGFAGVGAAVLVEGRNAQLAALDAHRAFRAAQAIGELGVGPGAQERKLGGFPASGLEPDGGLAIDAEAMALRFDGAHGAVEELGHLAVGAGAEEPDRKSTRLNS